MTKRHFRHHISHRQRTHVVTGMLKLILLFAAIITWAVGLCDGACTPGESAPCKIDGGHGKRTCDGQGGWDAPCVIVDCVKGRTLSTDKKQCKLCPKGTYKDTLGLDPCKKCDPIASGAVYVNVGEEGPECLHDCPNGIDSLGCAPTYLIVMLVVVLFFGILAIVVKRQLFAADSSICVESIATDSLFPATKDRKKIKRTV